MVYQEVIIASREVKIRSERVKMHKVLIKLLTKEVLSIPALKGAGGRRISGTSLRKQQGQKP